MQQSKKAKGLKSKNKVATPTGTTSVTPAVTPKRVQSKGPAGEVVPDDAVCAVGVMHEVLSSRIEPMVQDCNDPVHVDISFVDYLTGTQHIVLRLTRRKDFHNLYEAVVPISDREVGNKIEMFLRLPQQRECDYGPLKIGEWLIVRK